MATTDLNTLLPMMLDLPGCPDPVKMQALSSGCRRFCVDTGIWVEQLDTVSAVDGTATYTLVSGYDDASIEDLLSVTLDDLERHPDTWSFGDDSVLSLDPAPSADGDLDVVARLVPVVNGTEIAARIVAQWGHAIVAAAKVALKSNPQNATMPVKWFDPQGAAFFSAEYGNAIGDAKGTMVTARQAGRSRRVILQRIM